MKIALLLVGLLCISNSLFSQFQWEHTGGPEGFSNAELYYNKDFAFLYDGFQLYRTSDGQSWEDINTVLSGKISITDQQIVIYTEQNKGTHNQKDIQFLISDDNGDTWYNAPVPQDAYYNTNQTMLCSHGIYFKAGEKLYRSQTGGQSWKLVSFDGNQFESLFSTNDRIFGRDEDKIYEFNPQSGKWTFSWKMPPTSSFESIYFKDNNIIVLSGNRFYSSQNNGKIWSTFHASSNSPSFLIEKDNRVYALGGNLLRYTEDGGYNWKSISLDKQYQKGCLINDNFLLFSSSAGCVLFDETSILYFPANQGLFNSRIQNLCSGQNQIWAQLLSDFSIHKYDVNAGTWSSAGLPILDELFFPLYISTSEYLLYNEGVPKNILISTNQGTSWDTLNVPFNRHNDVNHFFWIGDYIYVEGNSGPYVSTDLGHTWTALSKRLTSAVFFRDQLWASDDSGRLVVSPDNGLSWAYVDSEWENIVSLFVAEDRIFVLNLDGHSSLHSSADGTIWEYSGDGLNLNSATTGRFSEKKVWKQNGIYFFQQFFNRLHYSMDNCSSWDQVNLTNYNNSDIAVLNDTLYLGHNSGGGVIKSKMPSFDRPIAMGSIFNDLNGNGIKDPDETYLNDVQIIISPATDPQRNYFTLSNQEGAFEIRPSFEFHDKLYPNLSSEYVESIEPPFYIIHDTIENYDFAVRFSPNVTDGAINGKFNIQAEAGKEITAHITYQNKGTVPMSGSVGLRLDPEFTFINSIPAPSEIVNTDSLVWHFEDLQIFSKNQILVEGRLSSNLQEGALISLEASMLPSNTDVSMADNQFLIQDAIVSTFIPNQKSVFPAEGMTAQEVLDGRELEYTIRFQNPYDHVVNSMQISDALATNLDYTSIRITGSSHEITKWELLPAGILRVFFDNMNLAPMGDQRSQGFLSFAIRIRKDNNPNFNFTNKANIIFEKTRTITTNTVSTKMMEDVISSVKELNTASLHKLSITPNPTSNNCTLSTTGNMKGEGTIRIFHPNGQVLHVQKVHDLSIDIALETAQLPNGFYLINAEGNEGIMYGKLIVQK